MSRPRNQAFQTVGVANIKRSVFNLSYDYKTTCNIGDLIPVFHRECIPGDYFTIGNELAIRLQPMMAPIFHELNAYVHYFFVPHRILWSKWEDFITKGKDGNFETEIPRYFFSSGYANIGNKYNKPVGSSRGSLWDYLGYPTNPPSSFDIMRALSNNQGGVALPRNFRQLSYNLIWYEYYRDQNLAIGQEGTTINPNADYYLLNQFLDDNPAANPMLRTLVDVPIGEHIRTRCWEKDYFTSALTRQQRGNPVAFPIRGTSKALHTPGPFIRPQTIDTMGDNYLPMTLYATDPMPPNLPVAFQRNPPGGLVPPQTMIGLTNMLNANTVNLTDGITFDISELRLAFQIQRWMERNMRAGVRLKEFLISHFGVSPRDERLQRPEYLGGTRQPIIISEVLQTSSTDATSPQGHMSGHGISVSGKRAVKYHVKEHGTIMGILSIIPRTAYSQGIDRTEIPTNVYDYFFPEFQHLSEQEVKTVEIYVDPTVAETGQNLIFGFQGRYNEHRYSSSKITGEFRDILNYWHFGRRFNNIPVLNNDFVMVEPMNTPFLVKNYHQCLVQINNIVRAVRPMVKNPTPGLVDH